MQAHSHRLGSSQAKKGRKQDVEALVGWHEMCQARQDR